MEAYRVAHDFLCEEHDEAMMVGFVLKDTLSDNGAVTRGICVEEDSWLKEIVETKGITKETKLDLNGLVSMNMWGLKQGFLGVLESGFDESLRIGAHESGMIGEDPQGIPNNLMPYVAQVALGRRECLTIFGRHYDTPDGTCRRDYIHVVDLAKDHVKAVEYSLKNKGTEVLNLGTGTPYSVTEIVESFEKNSGVAIKHVYGDRRPGDLAESYANADKEWKIIEWKAEKTLEDMCRDTWNCQSKNPEGYKK